MSVAHHFIQLRKEKLGLSCDMLATRCDIYDPHLGDLKSADSELLDLNEMNCRTAGSSSIVPLTKELVDTFRKPHTGRQVRRAS